MNYRFTTAFDIAGPKSFRLSARQVFGDYGANAQNQPESIRSYLTADPGYEIFQVDQDGAEARVVAMLARPGRYRGLFDVGIKPHTYLALNIFIDKFRGGRPRDYYQFLDPAVLAALPEWPALNKFISKHPDNVVEYQLGKKTAHAKAYKMGPRTFQMQVLQESEGAIRLTFKEAQEFLGMYEQLFPEIIEWQLAIETQVAATRVLHNLFGYPRTFFERWSAELVREAVSFIPQSTVGVLTSIVFAEMYDYIIANKLKWDLFFNVHDAIVGQAPAEEIPVACALARKMFARDILTPHGVLNMPSEAMAGPNWNKKEMRVIK